MFYADLHIHSKYSRATSRECDLEHLAIWASKKGVSVLGTGDFTHPQWFAEIKERLIPAEPGLFRLRDDLAREVEQQAALAGATRFMLQVEISTIYKKGDRTRKVHHVIYAPDMEKAERLTEKLAAIGNVRSDGRPILGLDSRDLLEITLESGDGCYLVPAHIWTPWFAVLGSKSGFDSVDECYDDLAFEIFALETGLSSDPAMNWRLSQLDGYRLVSNSDAHSPPKIGREACVFETGMDYFAMRNALRTGEGYGGTVEFFPEEGKYHLDGHRKCGVRLEPEETREHDDVCPVCGKKLTVGVMNRVDELADRPDGFRPDSANRFRSLVPLAEVISEIRGVGEKSKKVQQAYEEILARVGSELYILEQAPTEDIRAAGSPLVAEAVQRMREGRVIRDAGYDGEYGTIRLFEKDELTRGSHVSLLFEMPDCGDRVPVMTFHSLGLSIIRENAQRLGMPDPFRVAGDEERQQLLVERMGLKERAARRTLSQISKAKRASSLADPATDEGQAHDQYQQLLREEALLDFDDLILLPVQLLENDTRLAADYQNRWRWISVDEYQDIDDSQYRLVRQLISPDGNICAIGDPDQSIYGFRGANPQAFLRFTQEFPDAQTIHLTRNYRSSQTIVDAALQAVAPTSLVDQRSLQSLMLDAELVRIETCPTERAEAEFVVHTIERLIGGSTFFSMDSGRVETHEGESLSFADFAVLYRTDAQADAIVEALARSGIPFQRKSHRGLTDEPAVQAMIRYVQSELQATPSARSDTNAPELLKQAADAVWDEFPEAADYLAQLHPLAERCGNAPARFLTALAMGVDADLWDARADRVSLLTLHASKGLEFPVVFLAGCEDGLLPLKWSRSDDADTAEERRLFFVGMTRAKNRLFLSHAKRRFWRGKVRELPASPFLQQIQEELLERGQRKSPRRKPRSEDNQLQLF